MFIFLPILCSCDYNYGACKICVTNKISIYLQNFNKNIICIKLLLLNETIRRLIPRLILEFIQYLNFLSE